ncbi:MAG: formylglycine-generating enzyme family protein [Alphaproteobacteria bacterium]|nr:formylglycine-generating enzyme family protein [Alphaproteobacteria bacterium]
MVRLGTLLGLMLVLALPWPAQAQRIYRDCPQCPEMVSIPAGSYWMGAPAGEEERENVPPQMRGRSAPQRAVRIEYTFSLGRYEVTREEFGAFVQATGYQTGTSCWGLQPGGKYVEQRGLDWRNPGFPQTARDPVVCVSWADARAYIDWLGRITGKNFYRLPSEAEWEYAARAGKTTARYWGDGPDGACQYANVADLTAAGRYSFVSTPENIFVCSDGYAYTAPVGQFRANAFGLYDMLGNVWEWTGDCWGDDLSRAPLNGSFRGSQGYPGDCSKRVTRGGSFSFHPKFVRAATRFWGFWGYRHDSVGFRVARDE